MHPLGATAHERLARSVRRRHPRPVTLHVGQLLHQWAVRDPERVALCGRLRRSYGELDDGAARAAGALRAAGVRPGDRVVISAENSPAFLRAWFGVLYAGATVVPVPVTSAPPEVAFRAGHARARLALVDEPRRGLMTQAGLAALGVDDLAGAALDLTPPPDGLAMVLYTSGTTGSPKGAAITHASLFAHTAALVAHTLRTSAADVVLGALPWTHSFGIRMSVLVPFFAGARVALPPAGRFDPARSLRTCREEGVTWLPGVPTMFDAWAHTDPEPLPALRWCLSAGAPLPKAVRERAERRLGAEVREGYGLTEATFTAIDAPPEPPRPGTVGRPVWGVEVRILREDGGDAETGEVGEIAIRGQNLMAGYLDDPDATRAVMPDGWLRSGDLGSLDERGALTVVDRLKDLIVRGGHNVVPAEVEDVLAAHPAVRAVAVVGRPDERYGEEIVAAIVLREDVAFDPAELDRWARARLSSTKVPREVVVLDELPLGPSRKVLRRELRARLADGRLVAAPLRPRAN